MSIWQKGLVAAIISGAAGGILNAFSAIGIAPNAFNLRPGIGFHNFLLLLAISSAASAILGLAFYLKTSPLPGVSGK